jgi:dolichol-phosphate mannosyltransferase
MIRYISIICPTLNEANNIHELYVQIKNIVKYPWELIFVDDHSTDGTREEILTIARKDPRVRLIFRFNRKGLSSAVAEGILSSIHEACIIIDADLQHDIHNINTMVETANRLKSDLVISSRFKNKQAIALSSQRKKLSRLGNQMINLLLKHKLSDPLSGCFLIKKDRYLDIHPTLILSGFKILFDILSSSRANALKINEVPIQFLKRHAGETKLRQSILLEFLSTYVIRSIEKFVPMVFIKFCIIGFIGVCLHFILLTVFLNTSQFGFIMSQLTTSYLVMINNFLLNNRFTFNQHRLYGGEIAIGLIKFIGFCSLGALISLGFAVFLKNHWLGPVTAGVLGTVAGALWNFILNTIYTWKVYKKN